MKGLDIMSEITEEELAFKRNVMKGRLILARNKLRQKRQEVIEYGELLEKAKNARGEAEQEYSDLLKMNVQEIELEENLFQFAPTCKCYNVITGEDIKIGDAIYYVE